MGSNDQCEQFNYADSDHQHCECYRIVIEPMPLPHLPCAGATLTVPEIAFVRYPTHGLYKLQPVGCGAIRGACGEHAGKRGPKAVNAQEAADILGVNRRRHGDLLEMLRALTLYPWLNTAEDEKRRVAVRWVLTHWKE